MLEGSSAPYVRLILHLREQHDDDPTRYCVYPLVSGDALGARIAFEW